MSREIFDLIKSLTKAEKRQVKLTGAFQAGEKDYLQLFDVLEKMKTYNEKELKMRVGSFLKLAQLPAVKNYLYKHILKTLEISDMNDSVDAVLSSYCNQVRVLMERGLINQGYKILRKAKKLAWKYEYFEHLIRLLRLELVMWYQIDGRREDPLVLMELEEAFDKLENTKEFEKMLQRIVLLQSNDIYARSEKARKELANLMCNSLLQDESNAVTYRAKVNFYHIHSVYRRMINDIYRSYEFRRSQVNLMEQHPDMIDETPRSYLAALLNLVRWQGVMSRFEEHHNAEQKLDQLISSNKHRFSKKLIADAYTQIHLNNLDRCATMGLFEEGIHIAEVKQKEYAHWLNNISSDLQNIVSYNLALLYFGNESYGTALKYVNEIINKSVNEVWEDIYYYSAILRVIINFELEKLDTIEYLVKTTSNYVKKTERSYKTESFVLETINEIARVKTSAERKSAFQNLAYKISAFRKSFEERKSQEYFDFQAWVESKISDRSYAEIIREKYNKFMKEMKS